MENLRKRVNVRLVTNEKKPLKLTSKPAYASSKIFNENLVAVHKIKETLTVNRPAYLGMCILDLSKTLMYDFPYNYIKNKYGDRAKLLFTDMDRLRTYTRTFGMTKTNLTIAGKFKDEAASIPIVEFVGLKSKMYSYIKNDEKGGKTAKGIKKNIIKNELKHEDYKNVLLNNKEFQHKRTIRSQKQQLGSYEINKVSLSCVDDNRYIHNNGITSYAYEHYKIE